MTTKSNRYDHETYTVRTTLPGDEAGGGATTAYGKFAAFTAMLLFSAQVTVTVAGTATTNIFSFIRLVSSNTSTSTIATTSLGVSGVGITTNVALATAAGGLSINQGDALYVLSGSDATGKVAVGWEVGLVPGANITA